LVSHFTGSGSIVRVDSHIIDGKIEVYIEAAPVPGEGRSIRRLSGKTGAARIRLRVRTPAALVGTSENRIPRSFSPFFLIPAAIPDALNPGHAMFSITPPPLTPNAVALRKLDLGG